MMSRLSKLDRDKLNVLRISQDQTTGWDTGRVNFEISISGQTMFEAQASFAELGLPERVEMFEQGENNDPQFRLPYRLAEALLTLTVEYMSDRTLWLDIDLLDKHLAIVPWERLVSEHVGHHLTDRSMNILRVPDLLFLPALFGRTTNIVLCANEREDGADKPKWLDLLNLIKHIFDSPLSNPVRVHVFTDSRSAKELQGYSSHFVTIYDPEKSLSYSPSESARGLLSQQGQLDNEWLMWMAGALRDVTVDVVHFFCDGCMALDQGALVFSASPRAEANQRAETESERDRHANAQEIDFFLTRIGAYSVALTATEHCSSVVGLRLLSAQLARLRTGPVLLHYARSDPDFIDLCVAYRFLYTHVSNNLKLSPALTLHCTPTLIHKDLKDTSLRFSDSLNYLWSTRTYLQEATGGGGLDPEQEYKPERDDRESLAWAVAAYRFMEKMAAGLNREEFEYEPHPVLLGMREAINHAADSVHAYARRLNEDSDRG